MNVCAFAIDQVDESIVRCRRCSRTIARDARGDELAAALAIECTALTPLFALAVPAPAPEIADRGPCVHRGAVLRRATCTYCGMRDRIAEVHACELHGQCTKWKALRGVQSCGSCDDHEPSASA